MRSRVALVAATVALALSAAPAPAALPRTAVDAPASSSVQAAAVGSYAYAFDRRGVTSADYGEFQRVVRDTLDDRRGWWRAGLDLRLDPGRAQLTVVLASPAVIAGASSVCSAGYSCRVGNTVYVNDDRWRLGATPWRADLLGYRQMVVNHEVGHWLGMGHRTCGAAGAPAPVMQQQSKGMQGCRENSWPLADEVAAVASRSGTSPRPRADLVAAAGTDGQVWVRRATGPDWEPWGGRVVGAPAVVRSAAATYLLAPGPDANVWIRSERRGWWPFGPPGTRCEGPSAAAVGQRLVVACRGADGALWAASADLPGTADAPLPSATDATGTGWIPLGGRIAHGAGVAAFRGTGETGFRARYVAVGEDGRIWTRTDSEDWQQFSGHACGGPVAVAAYFQALACRDGGSAALRVWHFPSSTSGALLGGSVSGRPALSVDPWGTADVYAVGADGGVWVARVAGSGATDRFRPFGGAAGGIAATWVG